MGNLLSVCQRFDDFLPNNSNRQTVLLLPATVLLYSRLIITIAIHLHVLSQTNLKETTKAQSQTLYREVHQPYFCIQKSWHNWMHMGALIGWNRVLT